MIRFAAYVEGLASRGRNFEFAALAAESQGYIVGGNGFAKLHGSAPCSGASLGSANYTSGKPDSDWLGTPYSISQRTRGAWQFSSAELCSGGGRLCFVELPLGAGTDFVEFGVQPSNLGIQFNETQARRGYQPLSSDSGVILMPASFKVDAGGGLLRSGICLQVKKIEGTGFHNAEIIPQSGSGGSDQICTNRIGLPSETKKQPCPQSSSQIPAKNSYMVPGDGE
ncbi:MAG TPA: hypothetical protein VEF05_13095 [Terriglobales bacterium]|nr:hypothetical protein [Terriglobales bacterium]